MCMGCWEEDGMQFEKTDRAVKLAPSFAEASCGALHTVVDDWNLDDGNIKLCRDSADATKEDRKICEALLSMSLGERYATAIMADDPDFDPEVWRANNEI